MLVVTKIFPNAVEPTSAPFNRQQIAALAKHCEVEVLATIPWYPGAGRFARFSSAGALANVPSRETIDGLDVRHPRTLFIPRVAHGLWAPLYAASLAPLALRYRGKVDVLLGTWAYPDGVAAIALARLLGLPVVVKLHGSDMNVVAEMPGPKRWLRWMLPRAQRVVAVSAGLVRKARAFGVEEARIALVMNGVDRTLFHVRERAAARAALGLPSDACSILYVGNLKETKGIFDLTSAFDRIAARDPSLHLTIVGEGPARAAVERATARWAKRVRIEGARPLEEIALWMAACDVLTLPSWAEGTPNVVLEALASGRRVIATRVGGIPDLVTQSTLGELVPPRDPIALANALERAAHEAYSPDEVARLGARGGWDESAAALARVLREACDG